MICSTYPGKGAAVMPPLAPGAVLGTAFPSGAGLFLSLLCGGASGLESSLWATKARALNQSATQCPDAWAGSSMPGQGDEASQHGEAETPYPAPPRIQVGTPRPYLLPISTGKRSL